MSKQIPVPETHNLAKTYLRAEISPATLDKVARTVDVTFATDFEVIRRGWDGLFKEVLSLDPSHVKMERINAGAPVLDTHNQWSVEEILGVVVNARIENGKGVATLRLSKRDDISGVIGDIEDGIIRNISVGYKVFVYEESTGEDEQIPTYRAIDWEPTEISFVSVPADYNSSVRKDQENNLVTIIRKNTPQMSDPKNPIETANPGAPAPVIVDIEGARKEGMLSERKRVSDIRDIVRTAKLEDSFAETLITDDKTVDQARALVIEEWAKKDKEVTTAGSVRVIGVDESDRVRMDMEEALLHRINPSVNKLERDGAKIVRGESLFEMAKRCLDVRNIKYSGQSKMEIIGRALTTSDYPTLLSNVTNKILRRSYDESPQTFKPFCREQTATDFKDITGIQFGGSLDLKKVQEDGEYERGVLEESSEKLRVETFGKIVGITRKAIINDDVNGFSRVAELFGKAAANKESEIVWGLITANAGLGVTMSDAKTLFHAGHNNYTASGAAPDVAGLSAGRVAMRRQKGLKNELLNLMPKFFVVPPELETEAQKLMTSITPRQESDVNPFSGLLQIIVEQRLTNVYKWMLIANPSQIDTISYAYLEGNQGLYTESRQHFDGDGIEVKARLDFGATVWDYRGFYLNKGQA